MAANDSNSGRNTITTIELPADIEGVTFSAPVEERKGDMVSRDLKPASSALGGWDISTVRDWLQGLPSLDMEDIAADGGVTVAMVVQQEAHEMAGRLSRALASSTPESVKPRSDPRWAQAAVCLHQAGFHDLGEFIDQAEEISASPAEAEKVEACITDIKAGLCCPRIHGCEQNDGEFCLVRQAFARAGLIADPFDVLPAPAEARGDQPEGEA